MLAISPDPISILKQFSDKYEIQYPLLSDEGSRLIRQLGILNREIAEDNPVYGIPHPGSYMVDAEGTIFDKSFYEKYAVRESIIDMLKESFAVDTRGGEAAEVVTPHLRAKAFFSSPTIRRGQMTVLTLEVDLKEGMHVYGEPLPAGYFTTSVTVDSGAVVVVDSVEMPEPEALHQEAIGEKLPVYSGRLVIRARCRGVGADEERAATVGITLHYQACDDRVCYPPERVRFELPLRVLPHDWERIR